MSESISLWNPRANVSSDGAGTTIIKYSCPSRVNVQAPYDREKADGRVLYVSSLQALCIKKLVNFPEQVHHLGPTRLLYEPPKTSGAHDLLRELIPDFSYSCGEEDELDPSTFLKTVDPRLWAVLIQVYTGLPKPFRTYSLPLADRHLPLLQHIPSTHDFSLVTIIELHACSTLNDETILRLRNLHSLGVLDISETKVTSWGINNLAKTVVDNNNPHISSNNAHPGGLWRLRILCLRDCKKIDDTVFEGLSKFPMLSVIDLRGTRCTSSAYKSTAFSPSANARLFHPTSLQHSLDELLAAVKREDGRQISDTSHPIPRLFSHDPSFYLYVQQTRYLEDSVRSRPSHSFPASSGPRPNDSAIFPADTAPEDSPNYVASTEARRHTSSASVQSFYAIPVSRTKGATNNSGAPPVKTYEAASGNPDSDALDDISSSLALYRLPPPWQPPIANPRKRPRSSVDASSLPAPKRTKGAVEGLLSRGGPAMIRSEFQKDREERRKAAYRPSPFKMPISVFEEERRKAASASSAAPNRMPTSSSSSSTPRATPSAPGISCAKATPSATTPAVITPSAAAPSSTTPSATKTLETTKRVTPGSKVPFENRFSDNLLRPSNFPIPRRPDVPLRPVSSLPIPQLPPEILAKLKAEAAAANKQSNKSHGQPAVQTKLSDFIRNKPMSSSSARGSSSLQPDRHEKSGKPIPTERRSAGSSKGQAGSSSKTVWPYERNLGSSSKARVGASGTPGTKSKR